jgi:nickel superoxide dismutase
MFKQSPEETTMKKMGTLILLIAFALNGFFMVLSQPLHAHCQIPCGIYDDHARVQAMLEDAITVEKSTKLIAELSGKLDAQSQNNWFVG